jgi:predicted O-methyltransferase YrrM
MARVPPNSALVGPAYRLLMAASLPRLAARRDRASRALFRALWTTALGRIPQEERQWIGRIEARRAELASADASPFVQWMSIAPVWGRFLMRTVRELAPRSCLELGTGFGISAAYQAAALELNGGGSLTTLEGAKEWADIAERGFSELGLARVETLVGPIEQTFAAAAGSGPFDYVFVDAEHSEQAIRSYFHLMAPHLSPGAVVVFDDIDWSEGTWRSWQAVRRHERVVRSASLGRMGVAIIRAA